MSEFCDKYGLKETQMTALIKDGWITISLPLYEKVVVHYKSTRSMQKTADELGISKAQVYKIVHRFQ